MGKISENRLIKVIVGPTGCGKSKTALKMAASYDSVIINSDSLQVYEDLPILTAQPEEKDKELCAHKLYGSVPFYEKMNARKWAETAAVSIERTFSEGKIPILVGGTGMYIKCLVDGISELPDVSEEIRQKALKLSKENYRKLCETVYKDDAELSRIIKPAQNRQMIRAYEILLQSGKSVRFFFEKPKKQFLAGVNYEFIMPDFNREALYTNINKRFIKMIENGAVEEVSTLLGKTDGQTGYSVFQAIGAMEITAYLRKQITLEEVIEISSRNSRRYAKRQITWFKNQKQNITYLR